jgi:hypothetical protein
MSQDEVLTLIRLARKYPESADALLSAAEAIGGNGSGSALVDVQAGSDVAITFPLPVFCNYKGHRYDAMLNRDRTVIVNGTKYNKPSPAAMSITRNSVNGWIWWWYRDPASGRNRQIRGLKERNLI